MIIFVLLAFVIREHGRLPIGNHFFGRPVVELEINEDMTIIISCVFVSTFLRVQRPLFQRASLEATPKEAFQKEEETKV